jgi:hypothetical protein
MSEAAGVTTDEILAERDYQDSFWGGPDHDDEHVGGDWRRFIQKHAERGSLTKVAALGWAVSEALDRCQARLQADREVIERLRLAHIANAGDSGPGAGARCRRRSSEALVRPQEWGSQ